MMSMVVDVVVTDMIGDIGMGVVVIVYSMDGSVGGVHSMVTVELSLPFITASTTLTSAGAGAEKGHQSNTLCIVHLNYIVASLVSLDLAC